MSGPRPATPTDAAELGRLCALLGYPVADADIASRLGQMLASTRHAVMVAPMHDIHLAGFVAAERRMTLEAGERVEVTALAVDPGVRRGGVGRRLMAAAEEWARTGRAGEVFLRSNILRGEAHAFYPAIGYTLAKTQHAYHRRLGNGVA